jgi:hypothetical protein
MYVFKVKEGTVVGWGGCGEGVGIRGAVVCGWSVGLLVVVGFVNTRTCVWEMVEV